MKNKIWLSIFVISLLVITSFVGAVPKDDKIDSTIISDTSFNAVDTIMDITIEKEEVDTFLDNKINTNIEQIELISPNINEIIERAIPQRDDVINECGVVIEEEGEYILEEDLDCSSDEFREQEIPAITINADNVVLNGNGYIITGPGDLDWRSQIYGVYAEGVNGITIINCEISAFWEGISLREVIESEIINNNLHGDWNGIYLEGSVSNTITDNIANENYLGIYLYGGSDSNTITGNTANGNDRTGIYLEGGSDSNTIIGNTANNNLYYGIDSSHSDLNIVTDNTANENYLGIYLYHSNSNIIRDNTANENYGEYDAYGIIVQNSDSNTLIGNTANGNDRYGILLYYSNSNNMISNTFCYNDETDIFLTRNNEDNEFLNNICDNVEGDENIECIPCDERPHEIDSCQVLDEEGAVYVLQNDVETDEVCFEIRGDDITLDCNGYSITGPGYRVESWGIHTGLDEITTITNCEVSGFEVGIVVGSEGSEIINNNLHGNFYGIDVGSDSNIIKNNVINENQDGIYLWESSSNTIIDNIANNNEVGGIVYYGDWGASNFNNIISNTFCYNGHVDIRGRGEDNELLYNQCDNVRGDIDCMPCDIEEHEIELEEGWNLISSYLIPYFLNIDEAIFGKLARNGKLIMVKDGQGRFFIPEHDFNNIPEWNPPEGYYVKVNEDTQFIIQGEEYTPTEIQLEEGWNTIAYPLTESHDMEYMIENILTPLIEEDILNLMKNGIGQFFVPRWDFNNIPEMRAGEGYMIKVTEDVVLDFSNHNLVIADKPARRLR